MPYVLAQIEVGERAQDPAPFVCQSKGHPQLDEVRLDAKQPVTDRRFRDGVRWERQWSGYCACCGRRVAVTPRRAA